MKILDFDIFKKQAVAERESVKKGYKKRKIRVVHEAPPANHREAIYRFIRDIMRILDISAVVTLVLYALSIYKFIDLKTAVVLATFSLIRGVGHFWGVRYCGVRPIAMRFLPVIGGFVVCRRFRKRFDEGYSALGASIWVLFSAVMSFWCYLLFGSSTCLIFSVVAFSVSLFVLLPILGIDLDGTAVFKSITFSISRYLGLFFVAVNGITTTGMVYWALSLQGEPVNPTFLGAPIISGLQRFMEEYRRPQFKEGRRIKFSMEPMNSYQMKALSLVYMALFISTFSMVGILNSYAIPSVVQADIECAVYVAIVGLFLVSVLEGNIIFFINLKRRIFGNI